MWAHGTPEFIMTSAHSFSEEPLTAPVYDRFVHIASGKSMKWYHKTDYKECETVCYDPPRVLASQLPKLAKELAKQSLSITPKKLANHIQEMNHSHSNTMLLNSGGGLTLSQAIERYANDNSLSTNRPEPSCITYVNYKRRYGQGKAYCLR